MKKITLLRHDFVFAILLVFLVGFIAGVHLAPQSLHGPANIGEERVVKMILPAVDSEGSGVVGILSTTVKPGTGKILVDTSKVLNYLDTQLSARTAASAAGDYEKVSLDNIDIIYAIEVNASIIEGPSAGAAMAISVLLALENRTSDGIAITGTINSDGSIGKVGAIYEKALAARENGAILFLVPAGQSTTDVTNRTRTCEMRGRYQVCKVNYSTKNLNIGEELNMTVREVANIKEAYAYFTGKTKV